MVEITSLPANVASDDATELAIYDASAGAQKTRKISRANFLDDVPREGGDPTFGDVTADNLALTAALTIGAVQITKVLKGALAVTASTLAASATEDKTATLTGAVSGDVVLFSIDALPAGLAVTAWVSAADTVTFRFTNVIGTSITGASYTANTLAIRTA